jgi:hypothetical protein
MEIQDPRDVPLSPARSPLHVLPPPPTYHSPRAYRDCRPFFSAELELPLLESLSFQFVEIQDPRDVPLSLARSPRLRTLSGYKLWGLRRWNNFFLLPSCRAIRCKSSCVGFNFIRCVSSRTARL